MHCITPDFPAAVIAVTVYNILWCIGNLVSWWYDKFSMIAKLNVLYVHGKIMEWEKIGK